MLGPRSRSWRRESPERDPLDASREFDRNHQEVGGIRRRPGRLERLCEAPRSSELLSRLGRSLSSPRRPGGLDGLRTTITSGLDAIGYTKTGRHRKHGAGPLTRVSTGQRMPGGDLLSQGREPQVPSALAGFTSVFGMGTGGSRPLTPPDKALSNSVPRALHSEHVDPEFNPSPRPISTGRLHALLRFYLRPINLVFYQGPYRVIPVGDLISGWVSHLDAFSAYPFRT